MSCVRILAGETAYSARRSCELPVVENLGIWSGNSVSEMCARNGGETGPFNVADTGRPHVLKSTISHLEALEQGTLEPPQRLTLAVFRIVKGLPKAKALHERESRKDEGDRVELSVARKSPKQERRQAETGPVLASGPVQDHSVQGQARKNALFDVFLPVGTVGIHEQHTATRMFRSTRPTAPRRERWPVLRTRVRPAPRGTATAVPQPRSVPTLRVSGVDPVASALVETSGTPQHRHRVSPNLRHWALGIPHWALQKLLPRQRQTARSDEAPIRRDVAFDLDHPAQPPRHASARFEHRLPHRPRPET